MQLLQFEPTVGIASTNESLMKGNRRPTVYRSTFCRLVLEPTAPMNIGPTYCLFQHILPILMSRRGGLNSRPTVYKTVALPLSYIGLDVRDPVV